MTKTLKGGVVAPNASVDDVKALLDTGATLVRYQQFWEARQSYPYYQFDKLFSSQKLIIDLHTYSPNRREILEWWKSAISHFNPENPYIIGVANEPHFATYNSTAKEVIKFANIHSKNVPIAVTCPYSDPLQFSKTVYYPNRPIYYEVHMYLPFKFTHQGVYPQYPVGVKYPTATLNKAKLKTYLKKVRAFQLKNKAPILVGEFSCSIYADPESRYNYLKDCIAIFNEYGWHWCYHAWREASVWDIESDPKIYKLLTTEWSK